MIPCKPKQLESVLSIDRNQLVNGGSYFTAKSIQYVIVVVAGAAYGVYGVCTKRYISSRPLYGIYPNIQVSMFFALDKIH